MVTLQIHLGRLFETGMMLPQQGLLAVHINLASYRVAVIRVQVESRPQSLAKMECNSRSSRYSLNRKYTVLPRIGCGLDPLPVVPTFLPTKNGCLVAVAS
jgi:hypothetical protein